MKGLFGFAKLVGVVVDNSGKHLKSYLLEFPKARWSLMQAVKNQSIPWEHRERWARQLVEGVSQLHSKGFVVGTLVSSLSPVLIDDSNTIKFWYFKSKFNVGVRVEGYYPPEYLHFRNLSRTISEDQCPKVTSKTDIFHLGLILWLLAENSPRTTASPVCIRERCDEVAGRCCDESHSDPITLPKLPESTPNYYRKIVDACRAKSPNDRPAARRLLELFPSISESTPSRYKTSDPETTDLSVMGRSLVGIVDCDRCRKRDIQLPFFHCIVCEIGDFDICSACYDRGAHCYETDHLLVEMIKMGSLIVPGKYHSSVKNSGKREILEL
jgi:serine/threonine protein kinase